jgi:threonylcarbamoyladenosine tRNA methylthiotransferase MtaB
MTFEDNNNQVITFGCRLNIFESEAIRKAIVESAQKNLIVFNSCAVTSNAEAELRAAIRKAKKNNPQATIIITGCAAQINPQNYAKMSEVSLVLGNTEKNKAESYILDHKININSSSINKETKTVQSTADKLFFSSQAPIANNLLPKIKVNNIMSVKETAPQLAVFGLNQTRSFLEIQNGCNHRCTFCIIPYGRGNSRSVGVGEIISNIKELVKKGYQEIVLTGVDISDYGKDLPLPTNLASLLNKVLNLVPELPRLRLSSVDLAELNDDFLEVLANQPRLMPSLHLSLQSGDDLILKRMKRRHHRQQIIDFCQKVSQIRPNITFGADIIAGFPTETNQAFENSLALISEINLVFAHIFPFSPRLGTPAAKMPQVATKIIKERAKILREATAFQLHKLLALQVEKTMPILLEKNNFGRTENFLEVKILNKNIPANTLVMAKIIGYEKNYLTALLSS